jgi:hypothetical protein
MKHALDAAIKKAVIQQAAAKLRYEEIQKLEQRTGLARRWRGVWVRGGHVPGFSAAAGRPSYMGDFE